MLRHVAALLAVVMLGLGATPHCPSGAADCGWLAQPMHDCCRSRMGIQTPRCCTASVQQAAPIPTGLTQDGRPTMATQLAPAGAVVTQTHGLTGRAALTDLPDRGLSPPRTLLHLHCSLLI